MFANNGASKHLHLTRTTGEVTCSAVDGHHGDRSTGLQNVEVMAQRSVGRVQHRLKFSVAESRASLERGEDSTAKGMFMRPGAS